MNRIELLAKKFEDHISLPWQTHLAPPEKTVFVVYPKEDERRLRAKRELFRLACQKSHHAWSEIDLDDAFATWMATQEFAQEYFEVPADMRQKIESEFSDHVRDLIQKPLEAMGENDALGVFGVGTLFGLTHVSTVLNRIEPAIRGRMIIFFPGTYEKNVYRLLDARDGWGYMAFPITLTEAAYL